MDDKLPHNRHITVALPNAGKCLHAARLQLAGDFLRGCAPSYCRPYTELLDRYFCQQFEESRIGPELQLNRNPYVIVALGGYARGEQCPHSDVDLLLLFKQAVPQGAEALVRELIYPLWDLGMEVGYALRTLKECLRLASRDYEVLTSLMDARYVCGVSQVLSDFWDLLRNRQLRRQSAKIRKWLNTCNQQRHLQRSHIGYWLEPDLKNGVGGLRDYHYLRWLAMLSGGGGELRDLLFAGVLTTDEYDELIEAVDFLLKTRNYLHCIARRRCDRIYREYQQVLADDLGYNAAVPGAGPESFLSDVHRRMNRIKYYNQRVFQDLMPRPRKWPRLRSENSPGTGSPDLEITAGALDFRAAPPLLAQPGLLLDIFEQSARLNLPIGPQAQRLLADFAQMIDESDLSQPNAKSTFEQILSTAKPSLILGQMADSGLLHRLIPDFQKIDHLVGICHDSLLPLDRHSFLTLDILVGLPSAEDENETLRLAQTLYNELEAPLVPAWAALLHETGRGDSNVAPLETGSAVAIRILSRFRYPKEMIDTVALLIREHLSLQELATHHDIEDQAVQKACRDKVQSPENLKMLYLLTVADLCASGPGAWNPWIAALLEKLFFKVRRLMK